MEWKAGCAFVLFGQMDEMDGANTLCEEGFAPAMRRRASIVRYTYLLCWPRIQFNRSSLFSGTPWGYVCVGIASNERQYMDAENDHDWVFYVL